MPKLEFLANYPKLHNQKRAMLVFCLQEIPGEKLLNEFRDFCTYDTYIKEYMYYGINPNKIYMLLLFVGEKGVLFSTFRTQNEENRSRYASSLGEEFEIVIKEDC